MSADERRPPGTTEEEAGVEEPRDAAEREEVEEEIRGGESAGEEDDPRPRAPEEPTISSAAHEAVADRPEVEEARKGAPAEEEPGRAEPRQAEALEETGRLRMGGTARARRRHIRGVVFAVLAGAATAVGVVALVVLLADVVADGWPVLSTDFITRFASRFPEEAGIKAALYGSIWVLGLTALFSFPLGVGAAIYLEEYAPGNWITRTIQTNIANLAGVPSIVYGILGLALFVRTLALGRSVLSGALTLSLLILPVIIIASQEAIRAVPDSIRQASYGLGATRWQTVRTQVLPMALPGILTGTILALSRAVGETAPLILVGAVSFIAFTPAGVMDRFTVLPLQIFEWVGRPQPEWRSLAAAAIMVLLAILLTMNAAAILLRNKYQKRQ